MAGLLSVNDVHVSYGNNEVVADVNFDICNNEIICIVGESGSGKTTLIKAIGNLLPRSGKITCGDIILEQKNLIHFNKKQWFNIRGKGIYMMFQNAGDYLSPSKRVHHQFYDCLRANYGYNKDQSKEVAIGVLQKVGLNDYDRVLKSFPFQLSGGMKQRISIAMAMALKPKLILADEPTSALDVVTKKQVIDELYMLKKDSSVIMVTHDIAVAMYLADKIMVMKDGIIVETGTKSSLMNNPQHAYTKLLLESVPLLKGQ